MSCKSNTKNIDITTEAEQKQLEGITAVCVTMASRGFLYIKRWHTGLNESLNRMYECGGDKTIDYSVSYFSRMDSVALRYNVGNDQAIIQFANQVGIPLSTGALHRVEMNQRARAIQKQERLSERGWIYKVKQRAVVWKLHKQEKKTSQTSTTPILVEADYYPTSAANKKKRILEDKEDDTAPPKKRSKKEYHGSCNCSATGKCRNNVCPCRKEGIKCSEKCHKALVECCNK